MLKIQIYILSGFIYVPLEWVWPSLNNKIKIYNTFYHTVDIKYLWRIIIVIIIIIVVVVFLHIIILLCMPATRRGVTVR